MKALKWTSAYFASSGGSRSRLNCYSLLTILKLSVDISLPLGWLSTEKLRLLLFDCFFHCFFLYRFLFQASSLLALDELLIGEVDEDFFLRTFFSPRVRFWIIFVIIYRLWLAGWHCCLFLTNQKTFSQIGSSVLVTRSIMKGRGAAEGPRN